MTSSHCPTAYGVALILGGLAAWLIAVLAWVLSR